MKPATGYRVRVLPRGPLSAPDHGARRALSAVEPARSTSRQLPTSGYGYLTTRDGTKLAYTVHPPTRPAGLGTPDVVLPQTGLPFSPPYPTLIEYSGYGTADPNGPQSGIAVLANAMGFAVVDVNMRGTGCSGGAYNFFETLQNLDGYDIIETVARQPWVKHNKVGMMGISFGAISQLFTAQTQPPSLAAISPLSTIDATATTLLPGGVLNTGFAVAWALERQQNALPAGPGAGQPWAYDRIQAGDTVCKDNQVLHGEAQDLPQDDPREPDLPARGRRPARPDHLRAQDQGAGVHGLPVAGRADRRALPDDGLATSPAPRRSGSPSPTASTSTRSTRRPSSAGSTSSSSTSNKARADGARGAARGWPHR